MARITNIRPAEDNASRDTRGIKRRTLMKGAAGAATMAGAGLLGGQSALGQAAPEASPAAGAAGDEFFFPSGVDGVPDAYLHPPDPFASYDGVPGEGGTVRSFILTYTPPPTPRDENQYWQELKERLGVTWEPVLTPQPDFGARSATLIASGDMPDLFTINPGQNAAQQYQAMAQGAFLDLTPYVTGDALQEFPNLATFPQYMWDNVMFQGQIFGVPKPLWRNGNLPYHRSDWASALGLAPGTLEESRELLLAFTNGDPDGNGNEDTWGMGRFEGGWQAWDNRLAFPMFSAPQGWRLNDDGSLEYTVETEEYRLAVEFLRQLFEDGGYHPDAAGMTFSDAQNNFIAGSTGVHTEGFLSFYGVGSVTDRAQDINPEAQTAPWFPIGPDGNPGIVYNETGFFGYTGIPSSVTDENRTMELLRILDYFAAPFGSEERIFISSGAEGVHHELRDNNVRITNDLYQTESSGLAGVMGGLAIYYYPDTPEIVFDIQENAIRALELGVDDPTRPLYSETNISEGPTLTQFGQDTITSIVTGRELLDLLDSVIEEWRSRGGDQIRAEFEEAIQQS